MFTRTSSLGLLATDGGGMATFEAACQTFTDTTIVWYEPSENIQVASVNTTARQLFMPTALRQELEPSRLAICGCHTNLCNSAPPSPLRTFWSAAVAAAAVLLLFTTMI
ncbi:hypothetical protein ANCCEY_02920 [Ancylostoma ceylanicum]|uniref:Uncharacterized protein n=1 Tax=Ancylostoma ceylanicum TaxID=53326 RepID=A0A0D6M6G4_9BILA|nr:hypothetical protein ANCCEY_02920 [Ancylostoma ceylanicum]